MNTGLLPSAAFAELARTRPTAVGAAALRAGLRTRRLVLLKSLLARLDRQPPADPVALRRFEQHWRLLEYAEQRDAAAVRRVVDYPTTGTWLAEVLAAPEGPEFARHLAHFGHIAVTAALRAGCDLRITLAAPSGVLSLTGLGALRCATGRARVHARSRTVRITCGAGLTGAVLLRRSRGVTGAGPGWSRLRTLPGSAAVLDDLDPYRAPPAGIGLTALPAAERAVSTGEPWAGRWRAAMALVAGVDSERAAEIRTALRTVVPLAPGSSVSATLRAAPGGVLTSLPAGPREMAEVLVHEVHHTKLAALQELVPLYDPDGRTVHRVGWRPDPRPVAGVLQGAYAHLALCDLWWRAAEGPGAPEAWRRRAGEQLEIYRRQVDDALSVLLRSDELTFTGREFVRGMSQHHSGLK